MRLFDGDWTDEMIEWWIGLVLYIKLRGNEPRPVCLRDISWLAVL